jgi:hypothetical protein
LAIATQPNFTKFILKSLKRRLKRIFQKISNFNGLHRLLRVNPNLIYFNAVLSLCIYSFNGNEEESDEEESDWKQRRYSLQLHSKGYRRTGAKISTQPRLDSEDETEQPNEFLSRQNTM